MNITPHEAKRVLDEIDLVSRITKQAIGNVGGQIKLLPSLGQLDPIIHQPARLRIMAALVTAGKEGLIKIEKNFKIEGLTHDSKQLPLGRRFRPALKFGY